MLFDFCVLFFMPSFFFSNNHVNCISNLSEQLNTLWFNWTQIRINLQCKICISVCTQLFEKFNNILLIFIRTTFDKILRNFGEILQLTNPILIGIETPRNSHTIDKKTTFSWSFAFHSLIRHSYARLYYVLSNLSMNCRNRNQIANNTAFIEDETLIVHTKPNTKRRQNFVAQPLAC